MYTYSIVLNIYSINTAKYLPKAVINDNKHFISCLIETLSDMYGEDSILDLHKGEKIVLEIDNKIATVDLIKMVVILLSL